MTRLAPPLVTRWAHDYDPQLPPAFKQHKLWVKEQMERANKIWRKKEEREIGLVKSLNIGDFFVNVIRRFFLQGIQLILSFD